MTEGPETGVVRARGGDALLRIALPKTPGGELRNVSDGRMSKGVEDWLEQAEPGDKIEAIVTRRDTGSVGTIMDVRLPDEPPRGDRRDRRVGPARPGPLRQVEEPDRVSGQGFANLAASKRRSAEHADRGRRRVVGKGFANPYSYVPAKRRDSEGPWADDVPVGHGRYMPELLTGSIDFKLRAETPLLLLDDLDVDRVNNHEIYRSARCQDGTPYFPVSSLKGSLRSAFEAVTNSRFGVFFDNANRLGYREQTNVAQGLTPIRIVDHQGTLKAQPLPGMDDGSQAAAWLPTYPAGLDGVPAPGQRIACWVEPLTHNGHGSPFDLWRVVEWKRDPRELSDSPRRETFDLGNSLQRDPAARPIVIEGWYHHTNENMKNKHDERVFFCNGPLPKLLDIGPAKRAYEELIQDYYDSHTDSELAAPPTTGGASWSQHLLDRNYRTLFDGQTAYAEIEGGVVKRIVPVTIGRALWGHSPLSLLDESLHPARSLEEFSPADSTFGWVRDKSAGDTSDQGKRGTYKGQIRIDRLAFDAERSAKLLGSVPPIKEFANAVPLAILSSPNPRQGRFYLNGPDGEALDHVAREDLFAKGQRLKGRKFYWHHADRAGDSKYWTDEASYNGSPREFRRAGGVQDSQNRSIRDWVEPGVVFSGRIQLTNCPSEVVGALLWLLSEDAGHLRCGFGKPLGFGSLKAEVSEACLRSGESLVDSYRTWQPDDTAGVADPAALVDAFVEAAAPLGTIQSYRAIAHGCEGIPVHYPRLGEGPHPDGKNFEWFVQNERKGLWALPLAKDASKLPYEPV